MKMNYLKSNEVSKTDYLIAICILVGCYFSFQHADLAITAGQSFAILNGHILDFYSWNHTSDTIAGYPIITYLLFAIWNIPVRLMGFGTGFADDFPVYILMWFKLLPTLFYLACAKVMKNIGLLLGMGENKAKWLGFSFIIMPLGVFSQFIFGQYDSFTLLFVLVGYYYFLKDDFKKFVLFFAIAMPFKAFSFLLFVPLLLMREKRIGRILLSLMACVIPYAACLLFSSMGMQAGNTDVTEFSVMNYIFFAKIDMVYWSVELVVLMIAAICGFAYFHEIDLENRETVALWSVYFCCLVLLAQFGFSIWNPQWLLIMTPFLLLGAFMSKHMGVFHALDLAMFVVFSIFVAGQYGNVNEQLMSRGVWHDFFHSLGVVAQSDLYFIHDQNLMFSLFAGILLIAMVFRHPKFRVKQFDEMTENSYAWIRTKFYVGMAFYLVPMVVCAVAAMN